ncbi:hypothetical protein OPV22_002823 [Ensete ventricosum]|uniref:Uncharacterized protein n=1 Tax=Ensete ventricosum TaxID=4639 RepID=A0AAV8RZ20_ENSVE|nr:hypothetical protein OPV22_002823 [Ensete ventricosum]
MVMVMVMQRDTAWAPTRTAEEGFHDCFLCPPPKAVVMVGSHRPLLEVRITPVASASGAGPGRTVCAHLHFVMPNHRRLSASAVGFHGRLPDVNRSFHAWTASQIRDLLDHFLGLRRKPARASRIGVVRVKARTWRVFVRDEISSDLQGAESRRALGERSKCRPVLGFLDGSFF